MTNTQVEVRHKGEFSPFAEVGTALNLKYLLETQKNALQQSLPKHVTPERLIKTMLVAANRTPKLLECTQASILETINRAGELGLDLSGTLGEAYPVPFNNKVNINGKEQWVSQCQLIIGYRGLVKLARQSGEIARIDADVVCEHDTFKFKKGMVAELEFIPNLREDRGEPIGAYALVEFKDGSVQFDFMPTSDIEKIRKRSKSGSDSNGNAIGAWRSDWSEMAKKSVFRRVAKWLPLSAEKFNAALDIDSEPEIDATDVLAVLPNDTRSHTEKLVDQLGAGSDDVVEDVADDDDSPEDQPEVKEDPKPAKTTKKTSTRKTTTKSDTKEEAKKPAAAASEESDPLKRMITELVEEHGCDADLAEATIKMVLRGDKSVVKDLEDNGMYRIISGRVGREIEKTIGSGG